MTSSCIEWHVRSKLKEVSDSRPRGYNSLKIERGKFPLDYRYNDLINRLHPESYTVYNNTVTSHECQASMNYRHMMMSSMETFSALLAFVRAKSSDAEHWRFLWSASEKKRLNNQSNRRWFETLSLSLWRHGNEITCPCPWYPLLAHNSTFGSVPFSVTYDGRYQP